MRANSIRRKKPSKAKKSRFGFASKLMSSVVGGGNTPQDLGIDFDDLEKEGDEGTSKSLNRSEGRKVSFEFGEGEDDTQASGPSGTRRMSARRRENLDQRELTMGLSDLSADFLDLVAAKKGIDWLNSLILRDPRFCIKAFFDDVAKDGVNNIEDGVFQPELLSPLLGMFQRSSVFSVWRPTSLDSIEKMMRGHGVGKGLDIKGKSAKKGKLSAYVPFLQIHEEEHKTKIRPLSKGGRIRVFYKKEDPRDKAYDFLTEVMVEMVKKVEEAQAVVDKNTQEDSDTEQFVLGNFREENDRTEVDEAKDLIQAWEMDDPSINKIDVYKPNCFGLEMPKRLFWEGYVMRAKDISRPTGSEFETGRPSTPGFQDMNFSSIKTIPEPDAPRAVVWQYTDPYQPRDQPDPDPMLPQTLLVAYEENGRVLPVVSDFDCFLLGTRGIRFESPLPEEQVESSLELIEDTEKILHDCTLGKSKAWTASWFENMKSKTTHHTMPKYGFADPKSYEIMKHAVKRLEEFGAVRHGAECFNYYFPQDLDDEFLVIGGNLGGAKYRKMNLDELKVFLLDCIDKGFTFPLNPKWVLCDNGWKAIWDKLLASPHPNVASSINAWFPPNSGIRERIETVHSKYPQGYYKAKSKNEKTVSTPHLDEADFALESYRRVQRAKRKLLVVLLWISIVQQSQRKVQEKKAKLESEGESGSCEATGAGSILAKEEKADDQDPIEAMKPESAMTNDDADNHQIDKDRSTIDECDNKVLLVTELSETNGEDLELKKNSSNSEDEFDVVEAVDKLDVEEAVDKFDAFLSKDTLSLETEMNLCKPKRAPRSTTTSVIRVEDKSTTDKLSDFAIIDAIINCKSDNGLTEIQRAALRRTFSENPLYRQASFRNELRRYTSYETRSNIPQPILQEFGGAKAFAVGKTRSTFKRSVEKVIAARRVIDLMSVKAECDVIDLDYLPAEWKKLTKESKEILAEKLSFKSLSSWEFNVFDIAKVCDCSRSLLLFIGWAILGSPHAQRSMAHDLGLEVDEEDGGYDFVQQFNVKLPVLCDFLRWSESNYLPNPYHNSTHAADVLATTNSILQLGGQKFSHSHLHIFSLLVAAVIHDLQHPGLNNNYQTNSLSEVSLQFNDESVLENQSINCFYQKMTGPMYDESIDIFRGLSAEQFVLVRSIIIRSVLGTDMSHHFMMMAKLENHEMELDSTDSSLWKSPYTINGCTYNPALDMICFILHLADISNPAKPHPMYHLWADKVLSEFYAQGDKEAALGLPISPLCNRHTTSKKQSQVGFIKFVVQPAFVCLAKFLPDVKNEIIPCIEKSLEFWENYEEEEMNGTTS